MDHISWQALKLSNIAQIPRCTIRRFLHKSFYNRSYPHLVFILYTDKNKLTTGLNNASSAWNCVKSVALSSSEASTLECLFSTCSEEISQLPQASLLLFLFCLKFPTGCVSQPGSTFWGTNRAFLRYRTFSTGSEVAPLGLSWAEMVFQLKIWCNCLVSGWDSLELCPPLTDIRLSVGQLVQSHFLPYLLSETRTKTSYSTALNQNPNTDISVTGLGLTVCFSDYICWHFIRPSVCVCFPVQRESSLSSN